MLRLRVMQPHWCRFVPILVLLAGAFPARAATPLVLSEFLASNAGSIADEDGDREDWIELRNASGQAVSTGSEIFCKTSLA